MIKIRESGIILFCSLIIALGCNSVKRNSVRESTERDSIATVTQTQQSATQTTTNETKQENQSNQTIEAETPDSTEFPKDADNNIEVVKILRNLPKGSKVRITHGAAQVATTTQTTTLDTSSQQQQQTTQVHEEAKKKDVTKEAKRFPAIAAIGIAAVIGIMIILFLKLPSFKRKNT